MRGCASTGVVGRAEQLGRGQNGIFAILNADPLEWHLPQTAPVILSRRHPRAHSGLFLEGNGVQDILQGFRPCHAPYIRKVAVPGSTKSIL